MPDRTRTDYPSSMPSTSCAAGSFIPALFPPRLTGPSAEGAILDEILEEQVVSSRGQAKPRGVKRKMSNYPLRVRGPLSRKVHRWVPELCPIPT